MQRRISTLRYNLNLLILRHSLPEVFDRLHSMVSEQVELDESDQFASDWDALILHIEKATEAALALAQLKKAQDEDLWR